MRNREETNILMHSIKNKKERNKRDENSNEKHKKNMTASRTSRKGTAVVHV